MGGGRGFQVRSGFGVGAVSTRGIWQLDAQRGQGEAFAPGIVWHGDGAGEGEIEVDEKRRCHWRRCLTRSAVATERDEGRAGLTKKSQMSIFRLHRIGGMNVTGAQLYRAPVIGGAGGRVRNAGRDATEQSDPQAPNQGWGVDE